MQKDSTRRQWESGHNARPTEQEPPSEIDPNYEGYLLILQERNKIVKKLQRKGCKEIELERKEQGFSLYLNGANNDPKTPRRTDHKHTARPKSRKTKTSAGLTPKELDDLVTEEFSNRARARTAPEKTQPRKNWHAGSVDIKTARGEKVKVKAPVILTGEYEDDFEIDVSYEDSDVDSESDNSYSDSSDSSQNNKMIRRINNHPSDSESDDYSEQISLTVKDVRRLRESLEMNSSIRQSLARRDKSLSDSDRESPISEGDEEIEEDLVTSSHNGQGDHYKCPVRHVKTSPSANKLAPPNTRTPLLKGDDVIVLELSPSQHKDHSGRQLKMARKKDVESLGVLQDSKTRATREDRNKPTCSNEEKRIERSKELKLTSPRKTASRPLSSGRKSREASIDGEEQARAVMAAMKAENEELDRHRRDSKSAPGRSQQELDALTADSRDRPASIAVSWKDKLKSTHHGDNTTDTRESWAVPPSATRISQGQGHLDNIVEKVLQLGTRGQRKLLRALREIELADDSESSPNSTLDNTPTEKAAKAKSSSVKKPPPANTNIQVCLHIFSNWGHPVFVGLTEVQFYDLTQNRLEVRGSDIQVKGSRGAKGDLSALCNGKCKTIKERHMWCCNKPDKRHPLTFTFTLIQPAESSGEFGIGKIRIWNYNKSLNDLGIGVCDVRVEVAGHMVFEGQVDRGCGNQVFNYAKEINFSGGKIMESSVNNNKSTPVKLDREPVKAGTAQKSVTPTIDKVSLFSHADIEENLARRSDTRLMNHEDRRDVTRPVIESSPESDEKPPRIQNGTHRSAEKPTESSGEPKARRRKHKDRERKSKMAARLDRSHSSVDSSFASASASMDRYSVEHSHDGRTSVSDSVKASKDTHISSENPVRNSNNVRRSGNDRKKDSVSTKTKFNPDSESTCKPRNKSKKSTGNGAAPDSIKEKPVSAIPGYLAPDTKTSARGGKPGSPYFSDEDGGSMLDQLRQITKDKKPPKSELPSWLNKDNAGEERSGTPLQKDDTLLDNWPTAGVPDLATMLDDDLPPSPQGGRRPHSRNLTIPDCDDRPSSGRSTPNRMSEIEQKRNEWKKKEQQFKLEESWTSLSLFDRSQKGRISLDLQKDILDEYLQPDKARPSEPDIEEEPDTPSPLPLGANTADDDETFTIPELPMGRDMVINIRSTWGDHHYVGLNGVEVFTSTGDKANVTKITADPEDINVLEEYNKDPRVVTNLIDCINRTRDDTHMWLTPYNKGSKHLVNITFDKPIQIAMMRIWNYNKSRIHSYRGAKDIDITLDGQLIFRGEITRACGGIVGGSESFGETILFTMEEDILELVSQHDQAFESDMIADGDEEEEEEERPRTADEDNMTRPYTSAAHGRAAPPALTPQLSSEGDTLVLKGQYLRLNLTETWGDPYYMGLTGLEVVGGDGEGIPLTLDMVDADPRDLHVLPGYERDDRTLDKLVDGTNITTSDEHMWLIPYTAGEEHVLSIDMGRPIEMSGLRFWNYNKSPEDTYRGAKTVHIALDDRQVSPSEGFLIRKGPGNCYFDFAQEVSFTEPQTPRTVATKGKKHKPSESMILDEPSQEYEAVQKPCGFIYQFQLLSTWGDPYYVGLNGVEFYDSQGNRIQLEDNNISAYPDSVNVLDGIVNDTRTPDKLVDGENDTTDGRHMWLAPVLPNLLNRVYVIFDTPMEIAMIKIWNYSKTGKRGVKDFALLVDDLLVYNGLLEMAAPSGRGILPTCDGPQKYHTILFTDDKHIQQREKHNIIKKQPGEQDVQLLNDRQIVETYSNPQKNKTKPVDQSKRPTTSVPGRGRKR